MATSVPVPMAMPTSAAASAGASFTPSPTITTVPPRSPLRVVRCPPRGRVFPWGGPAEKTVPPPSPLRVVRCSPRGGVFPWGGPADKPVPPLLSCATRAALSPGSTSAITSLGCRPRRSPMARAAPRLSPEIMTMRRPRARRAASAWRAPGLGSSAKAISARSTRPSGRRSASADRVAPPCCRRSASACKGPRPTPSSFIQRRLPIRRALPATLPSVPRPATACMSSSACKGRPRSLAAFTTARASGCSLPLCKLAAALNCAASCASSCAASFASPASTKATSRGWPMVSVPVLSKATVSARCASSSACASLIKMPSLAATPVPAMMAAGVARPSAQGQAITSTATARISATSSGWPMASQPSSVASAINNTTGTNTAATWSTRRWIGALAACASSTKPMILDSTVSRPTALTRISTRPSPLMLPPVSAASASLVTGKGSPVSIDSSTCVRPSSRTPSTGTRSPGNTTTRSPNSNSPTGISACSPFFKITCANAGRSACRARMAAVVWRLARVSSHLPSITSEITTAEASKYRWGMLPASALSHSHTDSPQPALVPMATSKSMLPVRAFSACQPAR